MTDWTSPKTSDTHTNELAATRGRDESNARMNYDGDTNIPNGTKRWFDVNQRFEVWDAVNLTWTPLSSKYAINVDQLDGADAGNASGNVPLNNGTVNANLNADMVDGKHAGNASGNVPVSNGIINTNLNADKLDGYDASHFKPASSVTIPSGSRMLFKQNTAPTGWTFVAEDNDRVLINTSTMAEGGATGGSWTISGLSGLANNHTLTIDEIPAHRHEYTVFVTNGQFNWPSPQRYAASDLVGQYTEYAGGGQPHNHTLSLSSNASWRPAYAKVITCTKD